MNMYTSTIKPSMAVRIFCKFGPLLGSLVAVLAQVCIYAFQVASGSSVVLG